MGRVEFDSLVIAAVFETGFAAGRLDENAAHGFGGGGEEVAAAVPGLRIAAVDEADVGFVDEGGSGKCLAGFFFAQSRGGEFTEFVVDEWEELAGGVRIALFDGGKDLCYRAHGRYDTARLGDSQNCDWEPPAAEIDFAPQEP